MDLEDYCHMFSLWTEKKHCIIVISDFRIMSGISKNKYTPLNQCMTTVRRFPLKLNCLGDA